MPDAAPPEVRIALAPPPGWHDKTMIVHSAPPPGDGGLSPNIVVARDALPASETFADYCARQAKTFADNLPGYAAEDARAGAIDGRPAARYLFVWTSAAGPLRQQTNFIDAGAGVIVSYTATAAADDFAAHQDVFNAQLAALKIEGGTPPTRH